MSNFTLKRKFPITANPQGTSTDSLTKIGIGNDIYNVGGGNADYVEVTQAEYNALSSTEKNNGTLYFITDAEGGGSGGGRIDGSTATPTDVVATWLACAGLHQSYTTLNEVLADSGVLYALINSTNAVDYLVRSTTWASAICANETAMNYIGENNYCTDILLADSTWGAAISASTYWEEVLSGLVPIMTSDTTPSGEAFGTNFQGDYVWKLFDGNNETYCNFQASTSNQYFGYKFVSPVCIKKCSIVARFASGHTATPRIEGSNNGTNWDTLGSFTPTYGSKITYTFDINNTNKYLYYRMFIPEICHVSGAWGHGMYEIQFIGRSDLPPVDDRINAKADKTDIAPVENGTTASRAYAVGQQFYLSDGKLYRCKQSIAQGATFTIGTNCVLADCVTEQLGKIDLLWTNPNPSQAFNAQEISAVSKTLGYDYFIICYRNHTAREYISTAIVLPIGQGLSDNGCIHSAFCFNGSNRVMATRLAYFENNKLKFWNGEKDSTGTQDNEYLVPKYVYGVKL